MSFLPLARPTIGDAELEGQARALRSGRLVLGPENEAFEAELCHITGAAHAVAVSSGTAALVAALRALELPPGSEVLVPAFTFPAPAHAVVSLGLDVVPVDVAPDTWNLDATSVARAIGPRTRGVIVVDQFGVPVDVAALGLPSEVRVVEDAACALGAALGGIASGRAGALGCLSFHPRKIVTTGEGGAVLTDDAALAAQVRAIRHHGQSAPGEFVLAGLNLRLGEAAAAVGRAQLARLPELLEHRALLAAVYVAALAAAGLAERAPVQAAPPGARRAWQTFALLLPEKPTRAEVIDRLRAQGIEAGPATYALHRIGSFAKRPRFDAATLPVADRLHDRSLALPLFFGMTESDVTRVVAELAAVLA